MTVNCRSKSIASLLVVALSAPLFAQTAKPVQPPPAATQPSQPQSATTDNPPAVMRPAGVDVPGTYVIGPEDVLGIVYWRDKEMSTEATVRPDGRIALPLINEVQAAGLTPEELQKKITEESKKYMEDASITVVVKAINSLKVFVTGQVAKPGTYPLTSSMTVIQLIALAGGLNEYANSKNIMIMRREGNKQISLKFNYKEVAAGKKLEQNIELKAGDTVVVP